MFKKYISGILAFMAVVVVVGLVGLILIDDEASFNYRIIDDGNAVEIRGGGIAPPDHLQIPSHIQELPVTRIRARAFRRQSSYHRHRISSVYIPNTVMYIGEYAFYHGNIRHLVIPDSVTYIARGAFADNFIRSLTLGNGVTYIGRNAFSSNQLDYVTIPDSVVSIGVNAFRNNSLTTVSIPQHTTVANNAFDSRVTITRR